MKVSVVTDYKNKSEWMKRAHLIARMTVKYVGDYRIALKLALIYMNYEKMHRDMDDGVKVPFEKVNKYIEQITLPEGDAIRYRRIDYRFYARCLGTYKETYTDVISKHLNAFYKKFQKLSKKIKSSLKFDLIYLTC